jgi:hypothetical protein
MAVLARHGNVSARKWEASLLVTDDRKRARSKARQHMAHLATVFIRRLPELTRMRILMAIQASGMLEPVKSGNPRRDVAFSARHHAVLSHEGVGCLLMQLHRENRRFKTVFCVATGALPVIAPLCELTPVGIRRVAVHTPVVQNWSAEITAVVALNTSHGCMKTS